MLSNMLIGSCKPHCSIMCRLTRAISTGDLTVPYRLEEYDVTKPFSAIPEVKGWPGLGTSPLRAMRGRGGDNYRELLKKHGPIFKLRDIDGSDHTFDVVKGGRETVVAHGPGAAAALYQAEGQCPSQGRQFHQTLGWIHKYNLWTPSMAFASGDEWRKIRSAVSKQATLTWANGLIDPLCTVSNNLIGRLSSLMEEGKGKIDDIRPTLIKWAYQGTALFVLGELVDVYSEEDKDHLAFMEMGLDFTRRLKTVVTPLPMYRVFPTKSYREFVKATNNMRQLGEKIMERRYQKIKQKNNDTDPTGILEHWLNRGFTAEEAYIYSCDLLASSFDAMANTATFLLFELSKQPALQEQLHTEITETTTEANSLTPQHFQQMKLLRQCVKEVLRLYPPAYVSRRELMRGVIINGYQVPAGTTVHVTLGLMSHDRKYFDQPMRFKPERWSRDRKAQPYTCLPFGLGTRACFGRWFAEAQLYCLLYTLIPQFKLATHKHTIQLTQGSGLIPTEPVPLLVTRR